MMRALLPLALALAAAAQAADRPGLIAELIRTNRALRAPEALSPDQLAAARRKRALLSALLAPLAGEGRSRFSPADQAELDRLAALPVPKFAEPAGRYHAPVATPLAARSGDMLGFSADADAPVTAPAAGRIAFAGPYRQYGAVVILDHGGGWKTLLTGLGSVAVSPGDRVARDQMIGRAAQAGPARIMLELRHDGRPVDPIAFMAAP